MIRAISNFFTAEDVADLTKLLVGERGDGRESLINSVMIPRLNQLLADEVKKRGADLAAEILSLVCLEIVKPKKLEGGGGE